jgi:hypothetical protein
MSPTAEGPPPRGGGGAGAGGPGGGGGAGGLQIHTGELISFVSALLLLPIMFLLDWYGVVGVPLQARRSGITTAENAWHVLTNVRWLMLLTILAAVGSVVVHAQQRSHGTKTDTSVLMAVLGTATAALVAYRVLIDPPNSTSIVDVKLGGYLGLACAIAIAIGGFESMRELRERQGSLVQKSRRKSGVASSPDAR